MTNEYYEIEIIIWNHIIISIRQEYNTWIYTALCKWFVLDGNISDYMTKLFLLKIVNWCYNCFQEIIISY